MAETSSPVIRQTSRGKPVTTVAPVVHDGQLVLDVPATCKFLGGISVKLLTTLRGDPAEKFPNPVRIGGREIFFAVDDLVAYVARKKQVA
jgi:predicted DNA-binding transcriptional regulator AlpA